MLKRLSVVSLSFRCCVAHACSLDGRKAAPYIQSHPPRSRDRRNKRKESGNLVDPENQLTRMVSFRLEPYLRMHRTADSCSA